MMAGARTAERPAATDRPGALERPIEAFLDELRTARRLSATRSTPMRAISPTIAHSPSGIGSWTGARPPRRSSTATSPGFTSAGCRRDRGPPALRAARLPRVSRAPGPAGADRRWAMLPPTRRGRRLPHALSVEDIERLIAQPERRIVARGCATARCSSWRTRAGFGSRSCAALTRARVDLAERVRDGDRQGRQAARGAVRARRRSARSRVAGTRRGRSSRAHARARRTCSSTRAAAGCRAWDSGRSCAASRARPGSRRASIRTRCAIRSRRICCRAAPTCAWCRSCSGTRRVATTAIYTHLDRDYLREVHRSFHPRA